MTDFKAKMHQIRFWLGLRPRPRCGSLQRSPRPPAGFGGALLLRTREGRGGEGGDGRRGEGKERAMSPPPHYLEEVYAYGYASTTQLCNNTLQGCLAEIGI